MLWPRYLIVILVGAILVGQSWYIAHSDSYHAYLQQKILDTNSFSGLIPIHDTTKKNDF